MPVHIVRRYLGPSTHRDRPGEMVNLYEMLCGHRVAVRQDVRLEPRQQVQVSDAAPCRLCVQATQRPDVTAPSAAPPARRRQEIGATLAGSSLDEGIGDVEQGDVDGDILEEDQDPYGEQSGGVIGVQHPQTPPGAGWT